MMVLLVCGAAQAASVQAAPVAVTGSTGWAVASLPPTGPPTTFTYGTKPLVPVMGDWDGNGTRTPGTFESGVFKLSNALPPAGPTINVTFGDPRGFPVIGDFNGDGVDDLAVYRAGLWQIRVETGGIGSGGIVTPSNVTAYSGSWPSTIPVAGDWDGNGTDGIGAFTALTGQWVLRQTTTGPDLPPFTYNPGVSPYAVVGDWDHDGTDTVGVRAGTAWLLNNQNDASAADVTFNFGLANDLPLVGGNGDAPPTAVADAATVVEDSGATAVNVLANDTDSDGGPKSIFSITQPANGTVAITGGGTGLTYTPNANYCNTPPGTLDTFTYRLNNATGSTATVSMTVTCVDDPPVAVGDAATVNEDASATAVDVLANDTDIDGGPKSIDAVYQPAHGTVVITGGGTGLTYQPNANYCNAPPGAPLDTFTYRLNGVTGPTATVSMTVTCVDDPPGAVGDSATVAQDAAATAVDVLANDTDIDGGPKSIASATDPAHGTVVLTGGSPGAHTGLTYQPDPGYCNSSAGPPDTFSYTLTPGSSTATVSMTVTCAAANIPPDVDNSTGALAYTENDPPTAIDTTITVTDPDSVNLTGATVQITGNYVSGQDVLALPLQPIITASFDAPTGKLTLSGTATVAAYETALEAVTYANTSDNPSTSARTVTYQARDTGGFGTPDTHAITITPVDDPPGAVSNAATFNEDDPAAAVLVLGNDTDPDGGPKSIASVTQPPNGTVVITGGGTGLTYKPNANYCNSPPGTSPDAFTYTLSPGGSTATVSISVVCINDNPVVHTTAGSLAYTENDPATAIDTGLTVTDPDAGAMITGATVAITANFAGSQDVLALTGVHVGITAGPQIGNTLTLSGTATPAAYQAALRDVTYANTSEGPSTLARTVTFTVTDDTALSGSATRGITVAAVNDPPSAVNDSGTTNEDTPLNVAAPGVLANDTDVDPGDTKTVVRLNGTTTLTQALPSGASVTINANGSYTYNPLTAFQNLSTGQSASDSFTYTMADGAGAQSTATVNLTINGVSDAPVAVADTFNAIGNTGLFVGTTRPATQAGKEITGSVLSNDTDPDTPPANLVAEPVTNAPTTLGGTITIEADGNFTYQPKAGDTGVTDTFTYRVCDSSPCNSGTVANATGTLSLPIAGQVWYVKNNQAPGGDGTSDTPFDTLLAAENASSTGDTVYVFDGNNTTTKLDTGYVMEAGERLIGESRPLSLDPDGAGGSLPTSSLFPGTSGAQPTLTASNEDVIVLASNVLVDGIDVDPSGTGGGIAGGPGSGAGNPAAADVTVQNVNVTDTGTLGTQPGIEMDNTTGANRFTGVTVTNGGSSPAIPTAIGVRLDIAGTVLFSNSATNTIATTGAKALDAVGTTLSTSRWNDITVAGSGTGAIRLNNTSGQPELGDGAGTDLSLQTTSGATAALDIASSNQVFVNTAGTDTISATGGPAVDIRNSNGSSYFFDSVSSTNSANDGINLDTNLSTAFVGSAGAIGGAAGIAVDVNGGGAGGTANVIYNGAINDGPGQSVEVTGRDGSEVSIGSTIADSGDVGGGIVVSGNSAGGTDFASSSKVLNTGASDAVVLSSNGSPTTGHTVTFANGGLDIHTTSGRGLTATGGGLVEVTHNSNSITTGTGTPLNVDNTGIGANNAIFKSISSNGATNGIRLVNTGTLGHVQITGDGTNDSGGTISAATGNAIELSGTDNFTADEMNLANPARDGVSGTNVTNFTFTDSTIANAGQSDTDITDSAFAFNKTTSANENNIDGNVTITGNTITNPYGSGVDLFDYNGTISDLNVSNNTITSGTIAGANPGTGDDDSNEDGIQVVAFGGTGFAANVTKATVSNNTITGFPDGEGIVFLGGSQGTTLGEMGTPGSATNKIVISGNDVDGFSAANRMLTSFITADVEGRGRGNFVISNNGTAGDPMTNVAGQGIAVGGAGGDRPSGEVELEVHVVNNFLVPNSGSGSSGIGLGTDKDTIADASVLSDFDVNAEIAGNYVNDSAGPGIRVLHRDSNGTLNLKLNNNTVDSPKDATGVAGIRVENGSSGSASFDATLCMQMTGNDADAGPADGFGDVRPGIVLFKRGSTTTYHFGIVGLSPNPATAAQTESFLAGINTGSIGAGDPLFAGKEVAVQVGTTFSACTLPAF
jgi:VCBS repeat-containing protein